MMIHHGRCGSSVVGNLLVQNPNIHWASELYSSMLAKWQEENQQINFHLAKEPIVENPIAILKNSISETTKPYYGFEIKPFHFSLINSSATEFLNQSFLLNFTYFILMRRKNRLRQIVSGQIGRKNRLHQIVSGEVASKKNIWRSSREDIAKLEKIHLPLNKPEPLVERIEKKEIQMQEVETLLAGKNVLNLTYEDDIEQDPQSAYRSICKFVNMEETKASVTLSKTNPFPLKDMIENFAEVKAALQNTPYEWMPNN